MVDEVKTSVAVSVESAASSDRYLTIRVVLGVLVGFMAFNGMMPELLSIVRDWRGGWSSFGIGLVVGCLFAEVSLLALWFVYSVVGTWQRWLASFALLWTAMTSFVVGLELQDSGMIRDVESAIFLTPAPLFLIMCLLFLLSKTWIRWSLLPPSAKDRQATQRYTLGSLFIATAVVAVLTAETQRMMSSRGYRVENLGASDWSQVVCLFVWVAVYSTILTLACTGTVFRERTRWYPFVVVVWLLGVFAAVSWIVPTLSLWGMMCLGHIATVSLIAGILRRYGWSLESGL